MKQNIAKVLTFSLLATSAVFISCVDNEKNLFDAEQLRQIYEETFPVKNIDPDGDWTMSRSVTAHVTVNGDLGEDYPIRIFDANPLSPESNAKLLAEGVANRSTSFNVVMDCATALDRVFVARVDRKGHYLVQPIAIENEEVKACFGNKEGSTTCSITRTITDIPAMAAPYTDEYISNKKAYATIIKSGWDLGSGFDQYSAYNLPVFKEKERWFKIQEGGFRARFTTGGTWGGANAVKVIVPEGSTWVIENENQFSDITEVIVENGGKIEITRNASLILTRASYNAGW